MNLWQSHKIFITVSKGWSEIYRLLCKFWMQGRQMPTRLKTARVKWEGRWRHCEGRWRQKGRFEGSGKAGEGGQLADPAFKASWRQAEGIGGAFKAGWRQAKAPSVEGRLKASWRQAAASAVPLGQVEGSARNKDFIFIQLNKQVFTSSWKLNGYLFTVQK